ncbi:phosphoenolpyruvate--protein phosphotransferase [Desulfovibrio sp. OttesenSCG-928-A18]|nr:phosphoenolpyruvate--protein phosphotransferase [Desulfovibrio sp. OttesenSCG-928-A18]
MAKAVLQGIAVSTGIAVGKCFFLNRGPGSVRHVTVAADKVESEAIRLVEAVEAVAASFAGARELLDDSAGGIQVEVLDSHLLICRDPKLSGEALKRVREQRMSAEWALEETVSSIAETFSRIVSPYIRERMEDVRLVADRIIRHLSGDASAQSTGNERGILLAHDLSPGDAIGLNPERIFSFATEQGGKTSHTGILARSLRIPALVGVTGLCDSLRGGELLIVDALKGRLLVEPDEAELAEYLQVQEQYAAYDMRIRKLAARPAETLDGQRIAVLANVESAAEAGTVLKSGGEGVGLVRTEFGYITRATLPDEEELYNEYRAMAEALAPGKVTFRTLDVGAEKVFSGRVVPDEANPALGLRAIRYCIRHQDIFRTQLRAVLRASAHGNVSLMFPLISGVGELRLAKSILNEAKQELAAGRIPFDREMPVGIMVELPSAVLMADDLAREVDFFSIGTNDLIQYSLGVDRGNRHVAHMHQPLHPAIVRAIKQVVDMAHREGISVSVCGEMAADPYCLPILLGMPVDELSLAPQSIPAIKHLIRHSDADKCRQLLSHALGAPTIRSISNMVRQLLYQCFPEDVSFFVSQQSMDA